MSAKRTFLRTDSTAAIAVESGATYRVLSVPAGEYLTVGAAYRASVQGRRIGLHRENGAGTYVNASAIARGQIKLEAVSL